MLVHLKAAILRGGLRLNILPQERKKHFLVGNIVSIWEWIAPKSTPISASSRMLLLQKDTAD